MRKKTFKTTVVRDRSMCFIPIPFDPRPTFGKVRAPVKVTLNGYTYRSTIASMGNGPCIPLRKSNREAARLEGNETLSVTLELDEEEREVRPPPDFVRALKAKPSAWDRWSELSYSHQREHVEAIEGAKKPETRARRLQAAVKTIAGRPAKTTKPKAPAARPSKTAKSKPSAIDVDPRFAPVMAAFAKDPQVSAGKMMASFGLRVNGKIFAMAVRGKLVAKLPAARVNELVKGGLGEYFDPRRDGRVMKEWVSLNGAKPPWLDLAREAHRFVKDAKK